MSYTLSEKAHIAFIKAIPTPSAEAPPGSDKFLKALNIGFWVFGAICVLGIIFCAIKMVISHRQQAGGENMAALGWTIAGCVIGGSCAAIAGAFTGQ